MISYRMVFGENDAFDFAVDEKAAEALGQADAPDTPDWARLDRHRCEGCPLDPASRVGCPAALAIRPVVERVRETVSFDQVDLTVQAGETIFRTGTSAQEAVRSLMGLLMALSACPIMRMLRPMACHHQPLSSREQTIFRAAGMYLLAQYFRERRGLAPDWSLAGLSALYKRIHAVNSATAKRLRAASRHDAAINGLVILDVFAVTVDLRVEDRLEDLARAFGMYLES